MNLATLDLNLLVPLDVLLQERSVTRAAARLGLGQPALSASLAKLRRHFGDELLIRAGNSYELTPLAVQLRQRVGLALTGVDRVFASTPFDPASSRRTFTVLCADYPMAVFGAEVARELRRQAPQARLHLRHHTPQDVLAAGEALRGVDGMILPHGFLSDFPYQDLFSDTWVCLVACENPSVGDALTMDHLATSPWVLTYHSPAAFAPAARQLQMLGIEPRVEVVVESFLALPFYVAGTDRIALVQAHLAAKLASSSGVRVLPCPYDVMPLVEALWWYPVYDRDPEHRWLRSVLVDVGRRLQAG